MRIFRKSFVVIILLVIISGLTYTRPPSWYMQTPTSRYYYYFVGSFTADKTTKAVNSAKAETVGAILFMINTTISAKQSFEKVYRRSSGKPDTQDARLFKKIKTRGRAVVSRVQFIKRHVQRTRDGKYEAFILARIPKKQVDKAIRDYAKMRARLKSLKTACIIITQYPDGEVKEASTLKSFIENFYRETLGYNIVEANVNLSQLSASNIGALTYKVKRMLPGYDQVILGLINLNERPKQRVTKVGGITMKTISVTGKFILRTIELKTMKVVANNDYYARGVSQRGARAAMHELISEFKKRLSDGDSAGAGGDPVFD